jgi:O-succinylbenzoate synthase
MKTGVSGERGAGASRFSTHRFPDFAVCSKAKGTLLFHPSWSRHRRPWRTPMKIDQIELREIQMPLVSFFETSFGCTTQRRIILVRVFGEGVVGYGEATSPEGPFYNHESTGTAWHILRDFVIPRILQATIEKPEDVAPLLKPIRGHNMAKAAVETAIWDLYARQLEEPLHQVFGGTRRSIDCGVSIGIQETVADLLKKIEKELNAGYQRVKIKIKPGWDLEIVKRIRKEFPKLVLMCDANSAYSLGDIDLFKRLDEFDLLMIEQPLAWSDILDHIQLQKAIQTPICLDESILDAEDARKAIDSGACKIINIKLGRVGGHTESRKVHDACQARGIPVWCGGMLEAGIGRAHNIALSTRENFRLPGDVSASRRYFHRDIINPEVEVDVRGRIHVLDRPGIGFEPDLQLIEAVSVRMEMLRL